MRQQQLYRTIYYWKRNRGPIDLDVLKDYKMWLIGQRFYPLTPEQKERVKWELKTVQRWIMSMEYRFSDQETIVDPGTIAFDSFIASLLPQIDSLIMNERDYVCLYHTLMVLGMQTAMEFRNWVNWLNGLRDEKGLVHILTGSAPNNISPYLRDPRNTVWVMDDYLEANVRQNGTNNNPSTRAKNHFLKLLELCDDLKEVIIGQMPTDDFFD